MRNTTISISVVAIVLNILALLAFCGVILFGVTSVKALIDCQKQGGTYYLDQTCINQNVQ